MTFTEIKATEKPDTQLLDFSLMSKFRIRARVMPSFFKQVIHGSRSRNKLLWKCVNEDVHIFGVAPHRSLTLHTFSMVNISLLFSHPKEKLFRTQIIS